eukprot:gnl/TRDRNA2_/TRDRNA2_156792_c0_seq2.p1 gnl/TRDRNA2_/TRDRNA2_156792_c0~~gnl/TRDRNA2_/TRDRNA2_156792_c0_seq2.p1  ORF type:complete len:588 (+),score=102.24 gnl/TRDRNA2_/TRDRNA2_156792_c0_seq2:30-1766(+)
MRPPIEPSCPDGGGSFALEGCRCLRSRTSAADRSAPLRSPLVIVICITFLTGAVAADCDCASGESGNPGAHSVCQSCRVPCDADDALVLLRLGQLSRPSHYRGEQAILKSKERGPDKAVDAVAASVRDSATALATRISAVEDSFAEEWRESRESAASLAQSLAASAWQMRRSASGEVMDKSAQDSEEPTGVRTIVESGTNIGSGSATMDIEIEDTASQRRIAEPDMAISSLLATGSVGLSASAAKRLGDARERARKAETRAEKAMKALKHAEERVQQAEGDAGDAEKRREAAEAESAHMHEAAVAEEERAKQAAEDANEAEQRAKRAAEETQIAQRKKEQAELERAKAHKTMLAEAAAAKYEEDTAMAELAQEKAVASAAELQAARKAQKHAEEETVGKFVALRGALSEKLPAVFARMNQLCRPGETLAAELATNADPRGPCGARYGVLERIADRIQREDPQIVMQLRKTMSLVTTLMRLYPEVKFGLDQVFADQGARTQRLDILAHLEQEGLDKLIDGNADGALSRGEVKAYLQALYVIADVCPEALAHEDRPPQELQRWARRSDMGNWVQFYELRR